MLADAPRFLIGEQINRIGVQALFEEVQNSLAVTGIVSVLASLRLQNVLPQQCLVSWKRCEGTGDEMDSGDASGIFDHEARGSLSRSGSRTGQDSWICSRHLLHRGLYVHVCVRILVVRYELRQERAGNFLPEQSPSEIVQ